MSRQAHIVSRSKMATLLIGDRWLIKREDGTTLFSNLKCPNNVWPDTPLNIHNYTNVKLVAIPKVLYHQENARLLVHLYYTNYKKNANVKNNIVLFGSFSG